MTERDWPDFAFAARKLAKLFRRKKPDAVVLWEDFVPFERVCVMLARKFGGKSLVLQHGIFRAVSEKGTWIYGTAPVASDRIGVWGPKFRRILLNHFVPREKIEVLGCPRFDALHNTRFDAKATRERLGIKENEKLVVLATSCTDFSNDEVKQVMEAASSLGARLVVKIHPIDMLDRVSWMREKAVVVQDFPLYELLNGADAVVVKISTVGLEAMVLGKPVAVFGKGLGLENAYEGTDAVLRASDEKGLEKALKIAFGAGKNPVLKQEMADFVQDVAFKQDGMAARRVAGLLERMMAGSST